MGIICSLWAQESEKRDEWLTAAISPLPNRRAQVKPLAVKFVG